MHPVPKDPKKHPWNTLADFVEGVTEPVAREAMQKMVSLERRSQVCSLSALIAASGPIRFPSLSFLLLIIDHWPSVPEGGTLDPKCDHYLAKCA